MPLSARILLGCDKTRGHLNPALCLARALRKRYISSGIYFYPVNRQWESLLAQEGFSYTGRRINALHGPLEAVMRILEAFKILFSIRPRYAVGYGGRRSMWAVWLLSWFIPTAIYEPNACFGKANLFLAFFVKKIFTGFPDIAIHNALIKKVLKKKMVFTGIPLKESFFSESAGIKEQAKQSLGIPGSAKVLLAFGGSSGAAFINHLVYSFFTREAKELNGVFLIHLTGTREYEKYKQLYAGHPSVVLKDFSEDMPCYYRIADAVIGRAGASSIAETSFFTVPAVLIPLPGAYAHQYINAAYLSEREGIFLIPQDTLEYADFKQKICTLLFDQKARHLMQANLRSIRLWNTPEKFAQCIQADFFNRYQHPWSLRGQKLKSGTPSPKQKEYTAPSSRAKAAGNSAEGVNTGLSARTE